MLLSLLTYIVCALPREDIGVLTGKWSKPVEGLRARLLVSPGELQKDMQRLNVHVELENVSDVANPIVVLYDPLKTLRAKMIDANGKRMNDFLGSIDMVTPLPYPLSVPFKGRTIFFASVYGHYGMENRKGARMIELTDGLWILDRGATASFSAVFASSSKVAGQWHGSLQIPAVEIPAQFP